MRFSTFSAVINLHLDFGIDAGWEGEILKRINRLRSSVGDVDETLVDFHLKSFTTGLVDMWGFYDSESAAFGRQGHWPRNGSAGTDSRINDLFCALVDDAVVIGLEADTNFQAFVLLGFGHFVLSSPYNLRWPLDGSSMSF